MTQEQREYLTQLANGPLLNPIHRNRVKFKRVKTGIEPAVIEKGERVDFDDDIPF